MLPDLDPETPGNPLIAARAGTRTRPTKKVTEVTLLLPDLDLNQGPHD